MATRETLIITDACIFLDLHMVQCWTPFFELCYESVTSHFVWEELDEETRICLTPFVDQDQLRLLDPPDHFTENRYQLSTWNRLSLPDRSVFSLSDDLGGILLTSDGVLRKSAQEAAIPTHGLLWLFNEMVYQTSLSSTAANQHLTTIFEQNAMYRNNDKLNRAWKRLSAKWKD
jgi:hypothetical protein